MYALGAFARRCGSTPIRAVRAALAVSVFTIGCAPDLDWRVVRPEGSAAQLMLPCRPSTFARAIRLAGEVVTWSLWSCRAAGATWALGYADLGDARSVPAALRELQAAAVAKVGPAPATQIPWRPTGFTPRAEAGRRRWAGQLAGGRRIEAETLHFTLAKRVFEATVVAEHLDPDAVEFFVASLQAAP
jgi:hypothetical protein